MARGSDNTSIQMSKFGTHDDYGFQRPGDFDHAAYELFMAEYQPILMRRSRRWEQLVTDGYDTVKWGSAKAKRFIRKGIPSDRRAEITIDLHRTFPNNIYFSGKDSNTLQQLLFNVLLAHANRNPHIGYCQGLNYIAGLLLLVTKNEEMSFFLLRSLTEFLLPAYYGPTVPGLVTDVRVFAELLRTKCPSVHRHVESFSVPWALVCSKWFVCLFVDVLPVETTLRVWDCLFNEGSKILIRVALTLVMANKEKILAATEFSQLVDVFKECTVGDVPTQCHEFLTTVFKLSSPLPTRLVAKLRQEFGTQVQEEEKKRDQRRQGVQDQRS